MYNKIAIFIKNKLGRKQKTQPMSMSEIYAHRYPYPCTHIHEQTHK